MDLLNVKNLNYLSNYAFLIYAFSIILLKFISSIKSLVTRGFILENDVFNKENFLSDPISGRFYVRTNSKYLERISSNVD